MGRKTFLCVVFLGLSLLFSLSAEAQKRPSMPKMPPKQRAPANSDSELTYDLSASSGTYNNKTYSEITLGLNWFVQDWLNWRNSVFTRQGTGMDSVLGLDTAARFQSSIANDSGTFGFDAFAGPGLRFASKDNNAIFAEAGLILRLGGIRLGFGAKVLNYTNTRTDSDGTTLSKQDTQYFIILGGSGVL